MSMGPGRDWRVLGGTRRLLRAQAVVAVALAVVAVAPAVLLVAWLVGDRWGVSGPGPLVLVAASALLGTAAIIALVRRWVMPITEAAVVRSAERALEWPEGRLGGVVELGRALPPGVSAALVRRREGELAALLEGATPARFAGALGARARGRRSVLLVAVAGLTMLAVAAGFSSPERAAAGWAPLLNPVSHLRGPVFPPLGVEPGHAEVPRGTMLEVVVDAPLRERVVVVWRGDGVVPRDSAVVVVGGRARAAVGPVDRLVEYRVRAPDGAVSETYQARPVDPLLLSGLAVELTYPSYLGRAADRLEGEIPPLHVPAGTLVRLEGRATRSLESVRLRRDDGRALTPSADGPAFRLDWRPDGDAGGRWALELRDDRGANATVAALELTVVEDAPPRVRVVAPGKDTVLAPSRRQPLVIDARDDHGLAAAELVYRRIGSDGEAGPENRVTLPLEPGMERALLRPVMDVSAVPLAPGDVVEYHVVVIDNSPAGQVGRSATYLLRLASVAELRDRAREEAESLRTATAAAAEAARELDRATRELGRRAAADARGARSRTGAAPGEGSGMDFKQARELERLAARHEDGLRDLAALRERLETLRESIDRSGLGDPDLRARLKQLGELHDRLESSGTVEGTEALREAVEALDPAAASEALDRLAEAQEALRDALDQSMALLEQAALEQEMVALAHEAQEIAARQEELSAAIREDAVDGAAAADDAGDPEAAARQDALAEQAGRWTDLLRKLTRRLPLQSDSRSQLQLGDAEEKSESARASMGEAAEQARQQQSEDAARSGEQAAADMAAAAAALDGARSGMSESRREAARESTQEAALEALRLAEREEQLRQRMEAAQGGAGRPGGADAGEVRELQSEQAAVQQGLQQLGRNLWEGAEGTSPLDREVGQALARAMLDLEQTLEGLEAGRPMPVEQAGRSVDALNRLAMTLLESGTRAGDGSADAVQEVLRRLSELAREQSLLNARAESVAPRETGDPAADRLRQLAEAQRGIARRVGEASGMLGGGEDVLGRLDQLAIEAEQIAGELDGGRLDARVRARQDRLFHRLLDAGRTMEREEYSSERAGETATPRERVRPPELDRRLLDARARYPGPTADELRTLRPAYRRLILDYFERLNATAAQAGTPEGAP